MFSIKKVNSLVVTSIIVIAYGSYEQMTIKSIIFFLAVVLFAEIVGDIILKMLKRNKKDEDNIL